MGFERKLRRREFAGGTPVLLPDEDVWWFFEPTPEIIEAEGKHPIFWGFGENLDDEVNEVLSDSLNRVIAKLAKAETDSQRVSAVCEIAWVLLWRNYRLSQERFERVMTSGLITEGLLRRFERFVVDMQDKINEFMVEVN